MRCIKPGEHGSTYGGNSLACAVGTSSLDVLENENLIENSRKVGQYLKDKLISSLSSHHDIKEIRGDGLLIGIELEEKPLEINADIVAQRMFTEQNIIVENLNKNILRITPPLTIGEEQANQIVHGLSMVL